MSCAKSLFLFNSRQLNAWAGNIGQTLVCLSIKGMNLNMPLAYQPEITLAI